MSTKKRLILNLFEMNCVSHITHGLWRLPGNNRERFNDIEYWTELAVLLDEGGFDAVFLADVVGTYDVFRGSAATAIREGLQIPNNDPASVVPAMAAVTRHLGFGITFSTTYEPPFAWARRASTLDHLTKGRVGWNIVTSYLPNAARNFGHDGEVEHDKRFEIADEYLDVLYKLWEGSWDDDAIVADREGNVFADASRIRPIHHEGQWFKVEGPHLPSPSRQRTPVLFTATASAAGTKFAGKHAEVVFTGGPTEESLRKTIAGIREAAVAAGRRAEDVRFVSIAGVIVAPTESEAKAKLAHYQELASRDGYLAHTSLPWDPTALPPEAKLKDVTDTEGGVGRWRVFDPEQTVGEFLGGFGDLGRQPLLAVGDPEQVADEIERWLDEVGLDGINLLQYHSPDTARDFIEYVVPVLRQRGRLRRDYDEHETLRDRIFGAGDRLPDRHHAARYRGGANLPVSGIADPVLSA
ncbi:LLM class flavin-dependent oxidoreductase [Amorphoplanes digitatis]|uniref:FMN-dependent oxidoreductase (Nitrilotriacetate monooxygenase family) n=1 Tax=Actinoplanes digitatis TaxID=1868 RepID=A0A7W7MPR0_9ACTN|nr:LLM class flavin-dependent oxidoreductase [Actinoplanes digitatis]MBB4761795.1 FMN-dependent oxidoreductase (nitrilotriacetate monooxygenase family) [Actinoplanes digitatis]GID90906.1 N5,N10-methylene tetrahydromethanopterin reductase [Actinoplanes digitatis]